LEDHFDAILYLGSRATFSRLAPELCRDKNYLNERIRRLGFLPAPATRDLVDGLSKYCAAEQK